MSDKNGEYIVLHLTGGYPSKDNPQEGIFIKTQIDSLVNNGIRCNVFVLKGKGLFKYFFGIFRLKNYLRYNECDIIHSHYMYCGWTARFATFKIPLVVSLMGTDVYGRINGKGKEILISKLFHYYCSKILCRTVKRVIVKSENIGKYLKLKSYDVIPNGVDFKVFKLNPIFNKKEIGLNEFEKYILFAGTNDRNEKRYSLAFESVNKLKKNGVNVDLLILKGISQEKFVEYLNVADVLLLTSYHEGSPNVVKEALACNLPVVSVDVGDVRERIEGVDNCYIADDNPEDISHKINLILKSGKRSNNGREKISDLSINIIAELINKIYRNILMN